MIDYTLFQHQEEAVSYALEHHYSINCMSMGTGKTLVAIELAKRTKLRTLVVAPAFLLNTWKSEIEKFSDIEGIVIRDYFPYRKGEIRICSYSSLKNMEDVFKEVDLVIADEVHYLKNIEAKRTIYFHNWLKQSEAVRFLGLTGTPVKNRVTEWYSLLLLCGYNQEDTSGVSIQLRHPTYWNFARTFCNERQFKVKGRIVRIFEGHKNVEELKELLVGKYFRVKASEVLDLPPITRKDIILEPDKIDHELLQAWEQGNRNKSFMKSKVNSAMIKAPHTAKYAKDLIDQGEGPLVIFTSHQASAEDIAKRLNCPFIHGQTDMYIRHKLVEEFQNEGLPALVATVGALGTGVTLTKSNNLIFNDLDFVPGEIAQAEKRIHRIGTTKHCTIHRILWGKVDQHICKTLDKKLETLRAVM